MVVKKREHEREVLLAETVTIEDYQGDTLAMLLNYNSADEPFGAALLEFDLTDKGERGTWVTAEDLEAVADMLNKVALAIRVAGKAPPKQTRRRRRTKR